ncbi:MFS transporter [Nibrella saemangeumensis]|uniref:MFS transporter n=1 Tax=Nibrella saemangeumensis TaxID=1084526 RepID=A0ABP8MAA4_9BACT
MNASTSTYRWRDNLLVRNISTFATHAQARAVGMVFASDSLLFGSWVAHIPYIKQKLQLSDAGLGLTLFAMPVGLLIMNPLTGWIIARIGEAKACFYGALIFCLGMCLAINADHISILVAGLLVNGLSSALLNVAMNTSATNIERADGIQIMASSHGMWSLGGMLGSAIAGVAIALHIPPNIHVMVIAALIALLTYSLRPVLQNIPTQKTDSTASFVRPNVDLLLMILIGLAVAMGEGLAFDWSAVYLRETLGATSQVAALGFGCFSLTMTLGRFTGDALVPLVGAKRWLQVSGLIGAAGIAVAVLLPYPATALLGFALLGAGCSLGAPILYGASMRVPGISPAAGLATFATFSFIGFLAGPPIIGFVAEGYGLAYGLALVGVMMLLSAVLSKRVKLY